jgi:uncharacterized protein (TIGR00369 family)
MHTLIKQYIDSNAFSRLIGMHFQIIKLGEIKYEVLVTNQHLATPNAAHGGLVAALVDGALGVAGLSLVCHQNKVVSTIEYKLNYLSPVKLNDLLVANAKVISAGKRILVIECEVISMPETIMVAKAIGTFNAYDAQKAGFSLP